jgi:hypothetical protein
MISIQITAKTAEPTGEEGAPEQDNLNMAVLSQPLRQMSKYSAGYLSSTVRTVYSRPSLPLGAGARSMGERGRAVAPSRMVAPWAAGPVCPESAIFAIAIVRPVTAATRPRANPPYLHPPMTASVRFRGFTVMVTLVWGRLSLLSVP